MKIKRIKDRSDFRQFEDLYREAFPSGERAPYWLLQRRALQRRADFWELEEEGKPVGLAYVVICMDLAYLFYFAINEKYRGRQYGTRALKLLLRRYSGRRFFLALEDWTEECDNQAQRIKRHAFYKKCGLRDLPYKLSEMSVTYAVMGIGGVIKPWEYRMLIDRYLGPVLKYFAQMRMIKAR